MAEAEESGKRVRDESIESHANQSSNSEAPSFSLTRYSQKSDQRSNPRQMLSQQKNLFGFKMVGSYYDPALHKAKERRKRHKLCAFSFVEEGTYAKRGEVVRKKQALELLDSADLIPSTTSVAGQASTAVARILSKGPRLRPTETVPEIEWWDAALLVPGEKGFFAGGVESAEAGVAQDRVNVKKITNLVQHPPPVKNEYMEKINTMQIEPFLTAKEKKKRSRIRRLEKEKEKREKIKMGIIPPPEPKIKMSNYMQLLTQEAVIDPSLTEAKVQKKIEERQMKHLRHNLEKKLTPQQKREKLKRKLNRDTNSECRTAVFRIETLVDPSQRYKVDATARKYTLTGLCIMPGQGLSHAIPSLVVVEGGQWAMKKYKKLLLRRIKWTQPADRLDEADKARLTEELKNNRVGLVWEGTVKKRIFDKWKLIEVRSEAEARRLLADKAVVSLLNNP
eukprot:TRINITY_DN5465_c0_g1_i1.p1 TRINITY_DN5465_c0_g1~~TRINITY_DN5465_c0_g1_i1.p1  ORF type:complete len:450 (+),score=172.11 TRINITY_DN5465_c0_g1_i1:115-1464(+)